MKGANLHTRTFVRLVKLQFDRFQPKTLADLAAIWPPRGLVVQHDPTLGIDVGVDDLEEAGLSPLGRSAVELLHAILPATDPAEAWASVDEARRELAEIFGQRLRTEVVWDDPTGDRALVLLCTQGLAAHMLARGSEPGTYEVDLSFLSELAVRPGFLRYGARLVLEKEAGGRLAPRAIDWARGTHGPDDGDDWEKAKLAFRVSVAAVATIRDHAVACHFLAANAMVVATRTRLGNRHPVRSLLRPFQFRTPAINSGALVTLIPERAIFSRLFAFEWPALRRLYAASLRAFRWRDVPADLEARGVAELGEAYPYGQDARALWDLERRLVEEYLEAIGMRADPPGDPELAAMHGELVRILPKSAGVPPIDTRARLTELLAQSIFVATAWHEQVGGAIGDYLARPDFVVPAMRDGRSLEEMLPSRQTMIQGYMLGVLTNFRMPRITEDFSGLVPAAAAPVVRRWITGLGALARTIDARNRARPQPLWTFHPGHLEISVSI